MRFANIEVWRVNHLHNIWLVWLLYKPHVFACLVIYQGIPSKAKLAKTSLSDGVCPMCVNDKKWLRIFYAIVSLVGSVGVTLRINILGCSKTRCIADFLRDGRALVWDFFLGKSLVIWKLRYKYVFDQ